MSFLSRPNYATLLLYVDCHVNYQIQTLSLTPLFYVSLLKYSFYCRQLGTRRSPLTKPGYELSLRPRPRSFGGTNPLARATYSPWPGPEQSAGTGWCRTFTMAPTRTREPEHQNETLWLASWASRSMSRHQHHPRSVERHQCLPSLGSPPQQRKERRRKPRSLWCTSLLLCAASIWTH